MRRQLKLYVQRQMANAMDMLGAGSPGQQDTLFFVLKLLMIGAAEEEERRGGREGGEGGGRRKQGVGRGRREEGRERQMGVSEIHESVNPQDAWCEDTKERVKPPVEAKVEALEGKVSGGCASGSRKKCEGVEEEGARARVGY
eukprot:765323-Hanusia_phi.AAC.2